MTAEPAAPVVLRPRITRPVPETGVPCGPDGLLLAFAPPKEGADPGLLRCSTQGCSATCRLGEGKADGWRTKANPYERPLRLLPYTRLNSCPDCPPVAPDPEEAARALREAPLRHPSPQSAHG